MTTDMDTKMDHKTALRFALKASQAVSTCSWSEAFLASSTDVVPSLSCSFRVACVLASISAMMGVKSSKLSKIYIPSISSISRI